MHLIALHLLPLLHTSRSTQDVSHHQPISAANAYNAEKKHPSTCKERQNTHAHTTNANQMKVPYTMHVVQCAHMNWTKECRIYACCIMYRQYIHAWYNMLGVSTHTIPFRFAGTTQCHTVRCTHTCIHTDTCSDRWETMGEVKNLGILLSWLVCVCVHLQTSIPFAFAEMYIKRMMLMCTYIASCFF